MTLEDVVIGAVVTILFVSPIIGMVAASSLEEDKDELTEEQKEFWHTNQGNRPEINPYFEPDYSCLFDVFQLKCIPGSEQECPEGYGGGDTENCLPRHRGCPEGYHGTDNDETGQCYPNNEGCLDDYILLTDRHDNGDRCAEPEILCSPFSEDIYHPACDEYRKEKNSDNRTDNDISLDGQD